MTNCEVDKIFQLSQYLAGFRLYSEQISKPEDKPGRRSRREEEEEEKVHGRGEKDFAGS